MTRGKVTLGVGKRAATQIQREFGADYALLARAEHRDPFSVLGLHRHPFADLWSVRIFAPRNAPTSIVTERGPDGHCESIELRAIWPGFYWAELTDHGVPPAYRLSYEADRIQNADQDPYSFGLVISPEDTIDLKAGRCWRAYDVLGAQHHVQSGVSGHSFALWAPEAQAVSLIGDWNDWDPHCNPMRFRHEIGVWEFFLPGSIGQPAYAFSLLAKTGKRKIIVDPYARAVRVDADPQPGSAYASASGISHSPRYAAIITPSQPPSMRVASPMPGAVPVTDQSGKRIARKARLLRIDRHSLGVQVPGVQDRHGERVDGPDYDAQLSRISALGFTHIVLADPWEEAVAFVPGANSDTAYPMMGDCFFTTRTRFAAAKVWGGATGLDRLLATARAHQLGIYFESPIALFPLDPAHSDQVEANALDIAGLDGSLLYETPQSPKIDRAGRRYLRHNFARYETGNYLLSSILFGLDRYDFDGVLLRGVYDAMHRFGAPRAESSDPSADIVAPSLDLAGIDFVRKLSELVAFYYPEKHVIADDVAFWAGRSKPSSIGGLGCNRDICHDWRNLLKAGPEHFIARLRLGADETLLSASEAFPFCDPDNTPNAVPDHLSQAEWRFAAALMSVLPGGAIWSAAHFPEYFAGSFLPPKADTHQPDVSKPRNVAKKAVAARRANQIGHKIARLGRDPTGGCAESRIAHIARLHSFALAGRPRLFEPPASDYAQMALEYGDKSQILINFACEPRIVTSFPPSSGHYRCLFASSDEGDAQMTSKLQSRLEEGHHALRSAGSADSQPSHFSPTGFALQALVAPRCVAIYGPTDQNN